MVKKIVSFNVDEEIANELKRFSFRNWSRTVNMLLKAYLNGNRDRFESVYKLMEAE